MGLWLDDQLVMKITRAEGAMPRAPILAWLRRVVHWILRKERAPEATGGRLTIEYPTSGVERTVELDRRGRAVAVHRVPGSPEAARETMPVVESPKETLWRVEDGTWELDGASAARVTTRKAPEGGLLVTTEVHGLSVELTFDGKWARDPSPTSALPHAQTRSGRCRPG